MRVRQFLIVSIALVFCMSLVSVFIVGTSSAEAFNKNKIISDAVMDDSYTMTASQIDSFLNSKGSCINSNSGFKAINPIGYNTTDGFIYGDPVTAGTVIYNAAKAYEINPRILLTTLQKEQSLVTGAGGCSTNTIAKAMGYGCPDSHTYNKYSGLNLYWRNGKKYGSTSGDGICVNDSKKAGFTQQIIRAAWMLKYSRERAEGNIGWAIVKGNWDNSDDLNATYSGYMTEGCFKRSKYESKCTDYDGYATIDSTSVHMDNGATAALYRYTPHFSGNTNFVNIFSEWFGSVYSSETGDAIIVIGSRYNALGSSSGILGSPDGELRNGGHTYWQRYANGVIIWGPESGAWESMGPIRDYWATLGYQSGKMGYPIGPIKTAQDGTGKYQKYQNGYIIGKSGTGYWESKGSIRDYWATMGYQTSALGYPVGAEIKATDGGYSQQYENGYIIGRHDLGYWESMGPIRDYWATLGYQSGKMGYPTGPIVTKGATSWQHYQNGVIIGTNSTGYWESKGSIRDVWVQLGYQTGALGHPTGPETYSNGIWSQAYEHGVIQTKHGVKYKVTISS